MKRILTLFLLTTIVSTTPGLSKVTSSDNNKNYHLIYLDISHSKNRQELTAKLLSLLDDIIKKDDVFLLYLSNGYRPEIINSLGSQKQETERITSLLQTLNTSPPILRFDKDSILNIWDKNDIVTYNKDGKVSINFRTLNFHYFISSDLFKLEEDELIERFLLVKDLTKRYFDTHKIIIELVYDKDGSEPFIYRKDQLTRINNTGYRYLFTSY
jgi:hypothetical protein